MSDSFYKYFWFFFKLFLGIIAVFVVLLFAVAQGWLGELPSIEYIKNPQKQVATVIYSEDYEEMGKLYYENRTELTYHQINPATVQALIATEDIRFYEHSGVDIYGLSTALFRTFFLGKKSGASTITQQLAKNLFHAHSGRNIFTRGIQKIKEWYIAIELERNFSKQEIIALYFNTVPFLHNSYGLREAAQTYYSKEPINLTLDQSAVLVGMLKGPALYNPKTHPDNAKARRDIVLDLMEKNGFINQKIAEGAKALPITLNYKLTSPSTGLAPYLREEIRMELDEILSKYSKSDGSSYNIYTDGLKVYTTINSTLQTYAEQAMREHMPWLQRQFLAEWKGRDPYRFGAKANPDLVKNIVRNLDIYKQLSDEGKSEDEIFKILQTHKQPMRIFSWNGDRDTMMSVIDSIKYYKNIIQVGLCAMDPNNGKIRAWVGGIDFNHFKLDHVRRSTKRQVGSTIKPLLYCVALENGEIPCTEYPYTKPMIAGNESWDPRGTKYFEEGSLVRLKDALQVSDNRIAAQLIKKFGPSLLIEKAEQLGIQAQFDNVPAIALGTTDISVYEMIGAYSPFMNQGIYSQPYYIERIEDNNGNVIFQNSPQSRELISQQVANTLNLMMQLVTEGRGTATRLRSTYGLKMPIAGKTGTTQSNSDGWFIGSTPSLLTAIWVGADDPSVTFASTALGQGASSALPLWAKFYKKAYSNTSLKLGYPSQFFEQDSSYVNPLNCDSTTYSIPIENEDDEIIHTQIEE